MEQQNKNDAKTHLGLVDEEIDKLDEVGRE